MLRRVVSQDVTDVSEVLTTSIIIVLMMEAVSTSKTSVNFYDTTRRNIPEDSHLHICRRENLKSHYGNVIHNYFNRCVVITKVTMLFNVYSSLD
jgi:hypothetical protein